MKLEDQVVSLELAKRLKELGVKQESFFRWFENPGGVAIDPQPHSKDEVISYGYEESWEDNWDEGIAAFTVAELGEMLLGELEHEGQFYYWQTGKSNGGTDAWFYKYENAHINKPVHFLCIGSADTEADARAKMLAYLIENNLLTPNPTS